MSSDTSLDFRHQVMAIRAQKDDCWRMNQQAFCQREDVRRALVDAQHKVSNSEARWQQAQLRYRQLERCLDSLQAKLRGVMATDEPGDAC